jgi:uncharacterized repeat protein (TIGR02543 family)
MKIIKILVATLFVFAFSVQGTLNVSAGVSCSTIATDSGTGHYLITTSADLLAMSCNITHGNADYRNGSYDLQNNIDLIGVEWVPIGTKVYPFTGAFYGNGHVINHLTITELTTTYQTYNGFILYGTGFFGYVEGGEIYELVLQNASIDVNSNVLAPAETQLLDISFIGVLAASVDLTTTMEEITVLDASVNVTNASMMEGTDHSWPFTYVGGVVGRMGGSSSLSFSEFKGTINVYVAQEDNQSLYLGGLVGGAEFSILDNNWVTGEITFNSPADYELNELAIGGAAGYSQWTSFEDILVLNSTIDVLSDTYYAAVGGIIGSANTASSIEKSSFKGEIDSTTNNVGGLIGFVEGAVVIPDAITPQVQYYLQIDTNNVEATITGNNHVGGLVGKVTSHTIILDSWFDGDIVGHHSVGGLVGGSGECDVLYTRSFSLGTLSGVTNLGGIAGEAYSNNDPTDVFSRMIITAVAETNTSPANGGGYYVGGIFGYDYGTYSAYQNVYFAGSFINHSSGAVLFDPIANPLNELESVNNVYFDHTLNPVSSQIGLSKTTTELKLQSGYSGFNFTNPWFMDSRLNDGYAFFDAGFFQIIFEDGIDPYGYLSRPMVFLDQPTPPTRQGFVFGGWFSDQQYQHPWTFTTDYVTGDLTLYAKWTAEIPDTGEAANYGMGILGIGLSLWLLSKKTKKQA